MCLSRHCVQEHAWAVHDPSLGMCWWKNENVPGKTIQEENRHYKLLYRSRDEVRTLFNKVEVRALHLNIHWGLPLHHFEKPMPNLHQTQYPFHYKRVYTFKGIIAERRKFSANIIYFILRSLPTHPKIQSSIHNQIVIKVWKNLRDHSYFNASEVIPQPCTAWVNRLIPVLFVVKYGVSREIIKRMDKIFTRAM